MSSRLRGLHLLLVMLLAVSLVAAGCAPREEAEAPPPEEEKPEGPVTGGILFDASIGDATTFNPIHVNDTASGLISDYVHSSLVDFDDKINVVPKLATSWEVSEDGKVWVFHLREGVKWHDGQPFTARDVAFTFLSILHPEYTGVRLRNYSSLLGFDEYQEKLSQIRSDYKDKKITEEEYKQAIMEAFEEFKAGGAIKIIDDHTIQFTLSEPYAPFLVQSMAMGIIPEHILKDHMGATMKDHDFTRKPIGTGRFKFKEWKTGEYISVVANDEYYEGRPYLDEIVVKIIPDQNTVMAALETGEIDMGGITPEAFERFSQMKHLQIFEGPTFSYTYMGYNLTNPLFQDVRVRQAIAHAIDKETIVAELFQGHGIPAWSHGSPARWDYNPDVPKFEYDPEKAKQLLAEAGWKDTDNDGILDKDGVKFKFLLQTNQGNKIREQAAVIIQQQLKEVGIEVEVELVEWNTFVNKVLLAKNFEAVIVGWALGVDPDAFSIWHSEGGPFNFISYQNERVDYLLEQGRKVMDQEQRKEIYAEFQKILAEEQPYLFLYFPNALTAVNVRVKGPITATPAGIRWNIEKWWIPKDLQGGPVKPTQ